jgi:hypothetical protein
MESVIAVEIDRKRVAQDEFKRIVWLRPIINSDNTKSSAIVSNARATCATEQIE